VRPNTQGRTPEPPAHGAKILAENNGLFVAETQEKKVYFTFDLGYEAGYTEEVLDILKQNGIKGIFFLCGNYLKEKTLIRRMLSDGHEIGNHTDRHRDLPALSAEGIKTDIVTLQNSFIGLYGGVRMKFFRPPQGRFNEEVLKIAAAEGLRAMLWSIAIVDWAKNPIDAAASAEKIASRLHSGAIILFHITNSGTPEMLRILLPKIADKGYVVGRADELN